MNRFVGIPFGDGEPSFNGTNCYGLIALFYEHELGIILPSLTTKSEQSNRVFATYLKEISEHWVRVDEPSKFDVVAMAHDIGHPKIVQHFGLYIGDGKVLHTLNKINSHIVSIDSLKPFIRGFFRYGKINDDSKPV